MAPERSANERERTAAPLELTSRVPGWADGLALLDYLAQRWRHLSAADWGAELAAGRVQLDGALATPRQQVRRGQRLAWQRLQPEPPVDTGYALHHEDAHLLVVGKPAHLPVHGDGAFVRNTLVHLLRTRFGAAVQLVHRLDRETSGLLVVARDPATRRDLELQFREGRVAKAYLAVVGGRVQGDFSSVGAIGRAAASVVALRRAAVARGTAGAGEARTSFEVVRRGGDRSLLRCVPWTGRTHQIRVHLEAAGHPVLGDKLYGRPDGDYLAFVARVKRGGDPRDAPAGEPSRQLLHASELAFEHPMHRTPMRFTEPMPPDLAAFAPE